MVSAIRLLPTYSAAVRASLLRPGAKTLTSTTDRDLLRFPSYSAVGARYDSEDRWRRAKRLFPHVEDLDARDEGRNVEVFLDVRIEGKPTPVTVKLSYEQASDFAILLRAVPKALFRSHIRQSRIRRRSGDRPLKPRREILASGKHRGRGKLGLSRGDALTAARTHIGKGHLA